MIRLSQGNALNEAINPPTTTIAGGFQKRANIAKRTRIANLYAGYFNQENQDTQMSALDERHQDIQDNVDRDNHYAEADGVIVAGAMAVKTAMNVSAESAVAGSIRAARLASEAVGDTVTITGEELATAQANMISSGGMDVATSIPVAEETGQISGEALTDWEAESSGEGVEMTEGAQLEELFAQEMAEMGADVAPEAFLDTANLLEAAPEIGEGIEMTGMGAEAGSGVIEGTFMAEEIGGQVAAEVATEPLQKRQPK